MQSAEARVALKYCVHATQNYTITTFFKGNTHQYKKAMIKRYSIACTFRKSAMHSLKRYQRSPDTLGPDTWHLWILVNCCHATERCFAGLFAYFTPSRVCPDVSCHDETNHPCHHTSPDFNFWCCCCWYEIGSRGGGGWWTGWKLRKAKMHTYKQTPKQTKPFKRKLDMPVISNSMILIRLEKGDL